MNTYSIYWAKTYFRTGRLKIEAESEEDAYEKGILKIKFDESFWCRHPLAFLAEAADDICYRILDLEDAHEMKILKFLKVCLD